MIENRKRSSEAPMFVLNDKLKEEITKIIEENPGLEAFCLPASEQEHLKVLVSTSTTDMMPLGKVLAGGETYFVGIQNEAR